VFEIEHAPRRRVLLQGPVAGGAREGAAHVVAAGERVECLARVARDEDVAAWLEERVKAFPPVGQNRRTSLPSPRA
jgi:hypothetical protein